MIIVVIARIWTKKLSKAKRTTKCTQNTVFWIPTVITMKIIAFPDVTPCSLVEIYWLMVAPPRKRISFKFNLVTGPQLQIKLCIARRKFDGKTPHFNTRYSVAVYKYSAQFCFAKLSLHRCHTGTARFSGSTTHMYTCTWYPSSPTACTGEFSYTRSIYK